MRHDRARLGDMIRRTYEDKECVHFEYELASEDELNVLPGKLTVIFDRSDYDESAWDMRIVMPKNAYDSGTVYDVHVKMPTHSLSQDVMKVFSFGMNALKTLLGMKAQDMSVLQFTISEMLNEEDML